MRRQLPQHSLLAPPQNTFGLGIQVYKIQSKLPRINSGKNDRRQLIKQLENPGVKKYEKPEKMNNISYDKIIENEDMFVKEAVESIRRKSILNTRSNTLNRISVKEKEKEKEKEMGKERGNRPPSGKVILRLNSSSKKQKDTSLRTGKASEAPSQALQNLDKDKEVTSIVKVFPALQNEQLRKLEDRIYELTLRKRETKRNLKKQLKASKDQGEQERILRKLEILDLTDVVSEIVNYEELAPYKTENEEEEFGLEQYLLRERGQFEIEDDDGEYDLVYRPTVYVSQEQEQSKEMQCEPPASLLKQLQKEQSTRNQQ